jgi:protein gp37
MPSNIEWLEGGQSWNPIIGCTRVASGCVNCYAERMVKRLQANPATPQYAGLLDEHGRWNGQVRFVPEALEKPLRRKKPTRWFVNSMGDLFHPAVENKWLAQVLDVIDACRQHQFIVLTKRPELMRLRLMGYWNDGPDWNHQPAHFCDNTQEPLPNLILGVSVSNQAEADASVPHLLATPAAYRVVSHEPALGPVDWKRWWLRGAVGRTAGGQAWIDIDAPIGAPDAHVDLIITGGESGPNARPCDVGWIRSDVQQCALAGVGCYVKQLGSCVRGLPLRTVKLWPPTVTDQPRHPKGADMAEWPEDLRVRQWVQDGKDVEHE